jgi:hypothetical protein
MVISFTLSGSLELESQVFNGFLVAIIVPALVIELDTFASDRDADSEGHDRYDGGGN